jgi:DNA-binding LacI/PurR family transcriptional regulator
LGFKIEPIDIHEYHNSGKRLTQVLLSRGIESILLAPIIGRPGPYLKLEWEKFFVVAYGYSIIHPPLHRACFHHPRNIRLNLNHLRALGYRRIGLATTEEGSLRTEHNVLGAFLAEQALYPGAARLRPLLWNQVDKQKFVAWLRKEKPDCVLGFGRLYPALLKELGYSIPQDIGFSSFGKSPFEVDVSGVDERWDALGLTGLNLLFELMKNREYGVPEFSRFAIIEGTWNQGTTVRKLR